MKRIFPLVCFLLVGFVSWGQIAAKRKLEKANKETLTQEQRLTRAQDKKTKGGKKQLTMEKKVKLAKKQDRKARRAKPPKRNH